MKNKKALLIGIVAAIVVLAAVLALVLTQCIGGKPASTTAPSTEQSADTYELYWNLDMEEFSGKSEAGMSSRKPESDGYFHIRFFHDGEFLTLKAVDRKTVNAVDHEQLMGLEYDENGIITDVLLLSELPLEQVAWRFFVQSSAKTVIKTNSSQNFNGMSVMLEDLDPNRVWDMTGKSGEVGCVAEAIKYDRVMAIANLDGYITHVYLSERPNYMLTHEGECQHCKETVTWYEWENQDSLPKDTGHYQLRCDVKTKSQTSLSEDAKVCLDLNGHRVEGPAGTRVLIMNNPSIELAIMDNSETQTGVIAASGNGSMGMGIMVRHGALSLYSGTIDASKVVNTSGAAISVSKDRFFYMYGGKIIGGEAKCVRNATTGAYESGAGGALYVSGKFVMHDGIIENGKATSIVSTKKGTRTYNRGLGGNVYLASGAEFEMYGGTIRNGQAGSYGGNIGSDGTATILIEGGTISGGRVTGDGRMGGNIYASSKVTLTISGGSITGGRTRGNAGNVYCSGTFNLNGGTIKGATVIDPATGKAKTTTTYNNIFVVNGKLNLRGGNIQGGLTITDTSATDNKTATLKISGSPKITDGPNGFDLTISNNRVVVSVGTMGKNAKVGLNVKHGIFTQPTKAENADKFYSNIDQAEVIHFEDRLGVGRVSCLCGKEEHALGCDGKVLFWMPHSTGTDLPTTVGNYYLTKDVNAKKGYVVNPGEDVKLDLNGHDVTYRVPSGTTAGFRLYRSDNNSKLTITDTTDAPGTLKTIMPAPGTKYTGGMLVKSGSGDETVYFEPGSAEEQAEAERLWAQADYGALLWARGGEINILNGIFDGSNVTGTREQGGMVIYVANSTTDGTTYPAVMNIYGGTIKGGNVAAPGNIAVKENAVLNMYGGTIEGGKANKGGALYVSGTFNMYGGTIKGGSSATATNAAAEGGNVYVSLSGVMNVEGGTITGGKGNLGGNIFAYGAVNVTGGVIEKGEASGSGGNIGTNSGKSAITIGGNAIIRDGKALRGGNLGLYVRGNKSFTVGGEAQILNGEATDNGGNISVVTWLDDPSNVQLTGGKVSGGKAPMGGNVYVGGNSTGSNATFTATGGTIEKGNSAKGANIAVNYATATVKLAGATVHNTKASAGNILVETGMLNIDEGTTITNEATGAANILSSSAASTVSRITMTGGTVSGGTNSNVRLLTGDSFTMSGGLITGGSAGRGGNIYAEAPVVITGGTVEKGTTSEDRTGANIRLNNGNAKLVLDGATIPGGIHANSTATVTLKNNVTVNKGDSGCGYSLRMGPNARLILGEFTGGEVYVTTDAGNTLAENVTTDLSAYILTEVPETEVVWNEGAGTLVLKAIKSTYCTCGATKDAAYECHCADADKGELSWQAWEGTDTLPTATGNYFLNGNVELTADTVAKPESNAIIRIDLRGNKILLENAENIYDFSASTNVRLVVTDSAATPGAVVLTGTDTVTGGIMKLTSGNTFVLYRATMDVSGFNVGDLDGALAYINSGATFEMYSGALVGGGAGRLLHVNGNANLYGGNVSGGKINIRANNANAKVTLAGVTVSNAVANGTNVRVDIGELTIAEGTTITNTATNATNVSTTNSGVSSIVMTGGTISGGTNSNLLLQKSDSFTMSGGLITGGTATNGGNIRIAGDEGAAATVTITGGTLENGTATLGNNIYITNAFSNLVIDGATLSGGIYAAPTATVTLKNQVTVDKGESANAYSILLDSTARLELSQLTGGKVYVTGDVGNIVAENVSTDMTAYIISDKADVETIWNENEKTIYLDVFTNTYCTCGASKKNAYACHCADADKGNLTWQAWEGTDALPTATGNYYLTANVDLTAETVAKPAAGATIRIDLKGRKIRLENEENLYNFADVTGVRLVVTDTSSAPGAVVISGTATTVGGILDLTSGNTFAFYRGTLDAKDLDASSKGGSIVSVNSGASFLLQSGNVLGNKGSMIYVKGNAQLLGGTVTGASIKVRLDDANAKVLLKGVSIPNEVANATSVRVDKGELTIAEGTSITNTAAGSSNVVTTSGGTSKLIMTGGTISGGTNSNVRLMNGDTMEMSGGTITGGSSNRGGNIYVEGGSGAVSTLTITGGTIEKGTTSEDKTGANIRLNNGNAKLVLDGVTIPGGIHANSTATVTLKNVVTIDKTGTSCDYSLRMGDSAKLIVTDLTGGSIGIYGATDGKVIAENVGTDLSALFFSDRANYQVTYNGTAKTLVYKAK